MRLLGVGSVVAIVGVAVAAGAITIRGRGEGVTETSAGTIAIKQEGGAGRKSRLRQLAPTPAPVKAPAETAVVTSAATVASSPAAPPPPVVTAVPAATNAAPVTAPVAAETHTLIGPGRTALTDSIFAMRNGDSVLVNFDTHGNRTQRADKFEQMVRTTLPMLYGRRVSAVLDSVPVGTLLPSRDVVGELRTQGIHLKLTTGTRIAVWPQTRETSDGTLVVSYLAVVER